jgi:hypothetical protein
VPHIVLTAEQAHVLQEASETIELRDERGQVLTRMPPPAEAAVVLEAQRRLAAGGPRYSAAEVQARFQKLAEVGRRENLDADRVKELIRRIRAGEPV